MITMAPETKKEQPAKVEAEKPKKVTKTKKETSKE